VGELASDIRADPAAPAGDKRDLTRQIILRHGAAG
jgi:hypothetical protein